MDKAHFRFFCSKIGAITKMQHLSELLRPTHLCIVFRFVVGDAKRAVEMSHVSASWRDTVQNYSEPVWRSVVARNAPARVAPPPFQRVEWALAAVRAAVRSELLPRFDAAFAEMDAAW